MTPETQRQIEKQIFRIEQSLRIIRDLVHTDMVAGESHELPPFPISRLQPKSGSVQIMTSDVVQFADGTVWQPWRWYTAGYEVLRPTNFQLFSVPAYVEEFYPDVEIPSGSSTS